MFFPKIAKAGQFYFERQQILANKQRGPIEWPPWLPDLTLLDLFLQEHLKTVLYVTKPVSLADLQVKIVEACRAVIPKVLQNVT